MLRHFTPADYKTMAWANGKGSTVEMLRVDRDGEMLWRLSRASVVENGDFSLFAGIDRNLTVISGPGFDLIGQGLHMQARPLRPVAFSGDLVLAASGVLAPSDDFNVMTARHLPQPQVTVLHQSTDVAKGGTLALFALAHVQVNGKAVGPCDLIITDTAFEVVATGPAILVRLQL